MMAISDYMKLIQTSYGKIFVMIIDIRTASSVMYFRKPKRSFDNTGVDKQITFSMSSFKSCKMAKDWDASLTSNRSTSSRLHPAFSTYSICNMYTYHQSDILCM